MKLVLTGILVIIAVNAASSQQQGGLSIDRPTYLTSSSTRKGTIPTGRPLWFSPPPRPSTRNFFDNAFFRRRNEGIIPLALHPPILERPKPERAVRKRPKPEKAVRKRQKPEKAVRKRPKSRKADKAKKRKRKTTRKTTPEYISTTIEYETTSEIETSTTTTDPTTQAPTTPAPTTQAPTTKAPTTHAPTTQARTTQKPTTGYGSKYRIPRPPSSRKKSQIASALQPRQVYNVITQRPVNNVGAQIQSNNVLPPKQRHDVVPSTLTDIMSPPRQTNNVVQPRYTNNMVPAAQTNNWKPPNQASNMVPSIQTNYVSTSKLSYDVSLPGQNKELVPQRQINNRPPLIQTNNTVPPRQANNMVLPIQTNDMSPQRQANGAVSTRQTANAVAPIHTYDAVLQRSIRFERRHVAHSKPVFTMPKVKSSSLFTMPKISSSSSSSFRRFSDIPVETKPSVNSHLAPDTVEESPSASSIERFPMGRNMVHSRTVNNQRPSAGQSAQEKQLSAKVSGIPQSASSNSDIAYSVPSSNSLESSFNDNPVGLKSEMGSKLRSNFAGSVSMPDRSVASSQSGGVGPIRSVIGPTSQSKTKFQQSKQHIVSQDLPQSRVTSNSVLLSGTVSASDLESPSKQVLGMPRSYAPEIREERNKRPSDMISPMAEPLEGNPIVNSVDPTKQVSHNSQSQSPRTPIGNKMSSNIGGKFAGILAMQQPIEEPVIPVGDQTFPMNTVRPMATKTLYSQTENAATLYNDQPYIPKAQNVHRHKQLNDLSFKTGTVTSSLSQLNSMINQQEHIQGTTTNHPTQPHSTVNFDRNKSRKSQTYLTNKPPTTYRMGDQTDQGHVNSGKISRVYGLTQKPVINMQDSSGQYPSQINAAPSSSSEPTNHPTQPHSTVNFDSKSQTYLTNKTPTTYRMGDQTDQGHVNSGKSSRVYGLSQKPVANMQDSSGQYPSQINATPSSLSQLNSRMNQQEHIQGTTTNHLTQPHSTVNFDSKSQTYLTNKPPTTYRMGDQTDQGHVNSGKSSRVYGLTKKPVVNMQDSSGQYPSQINATPSSLSQPNSRMNQQEHIQGTTTNHQTQPHSTVNFDRNKSRKSQTYLTSKTPTAYRMGHQTDQGHVNSGKISLVYGLTQKPVANMQDPSQINATPSVGGAEMPFRSGDLSPVSVPPNKHQTHMSSTANKVDRPRDALNTPHQTYNVAQSTINPKSNQGRINSREQKQPNSGSKQNTTKSKVQDVSNMMLQALSDFLARYDVPSVLKSGGMRTKSVTINGLSASSVQNPNAATSAGKTMRNKQNINLKPNVAVKGQPTETRSEPRTGNVSNGLRKGSANIISTDTPIKMTAGANVPINQDPSRHSFNEIVGNQGQRPGAPPTPFIRNISLISGPPPPSFIRNKSPISGPPPPSFIRNKSPISGPPPPSFIRNKSPISGPPPPSFIKKKSEISGKDNGDRSAEREPPGYHIPAGAHPPVLTRPGGEGSSVPGGANAAPRGLNQEPGGILGQGPPTPSFIRNKSPISGPPPPSFIKRKSKISGEVNGGRYAEREAGSPSGYHEPAGAHPPVLKRPGGGGGSSVTGGTNGAPSDTNQAPGGNSGEGQGPCTMSPVCGSDGFTYMSSCFLSQGLTVACDGYCPCPEQPTMMQTSEQGVVVEPVPGSEQTNSGSCNCPPIYNPVCAISGATYDNDCAIRCNGEALACNGECPCLQSVVQDHQQNFSPHPTPMYDGANVNNEPNQQNFSPHPTPMYDGANVNNEPNQHNFSPHPTPMYDGANVNNEPNQHNFSPHPTPMYDGANVNNEHNHQHQATWERESPVHQHVPANSVPTNMPILVFQWH